MRQHAVAVVLLLVAAVTLVVILRTELVSRIRMRRLDAIGHDWAALQRHIDGPSFEQCVRDWRKWTYRDFYPDAP